MFLTRAFLDSESPYVRSDLRAPEHLHKTVMRAFPNQDGDTARAAGQILHRLDRDRDGRIVLLIQSSRRPETNRWPSGYVLDLEHDVDLALSTIGPNPAVRDISRELADIVPGGRFAFRLRANATRKIGTKSTPDGQKQNGRRVPVRGDEARTEWLLRRAKSAGFSVVAEALRVLEVPPNRGVGSKAVTVAGAEFEGILRVDDAEAFRAALMNGVGAGKAYGFGLLSIRRLS